MKGRAKKITWACIGAGLFAVGLCFVTRLTDPGYAYSKNKEFIEDSQRYDVLFFGNSHMANGVYPMELWHDQGIVSYNLAGFGHRIPSTYWVMENALDYASPQLVVMDCHSLSFMEKMGSKEMLHAQTDTIPFGAKKWRMICDLVEKPQDRLEFIWNFAAYHDRWWDLDRADFEKNFNVQKGAEIAIDVVPPDEMAQKSVKADNLETVGTAYLRRMIEECQSRDIEILLTYLPFPASEKEWQEALYAEKIANEYGISYLNFLELSVVDLSVDCSDSNSHLNGSGGRKVTDYIGQYIEEQYDIPDHRGEEEYIDWEEDYSRYTQYKLDVMCQLESLDKYLMMLADPAFDCCIYVNGKADIWQQNEMYLPLLENISGERTVKLKEAAVSGKDYFLLVDHEGDVCIESAGEESLNAECSFGKVCYETDTDGEKVLLLKEMENNYLQALPKGNQAAVQIIVMNSADGSIVNEKRFDSRLSVYHAENF